MLVVPLTRELCGSYSPGASTTGDSSHLARGVGGLLGCPRRLGGTSKFQVPSLYLSSCGTLGASVPPKRRGSADPTVYKWG